MSVAARRLPGAGALEVLYWGQPAAPARPSLVFVHGAYVGAWCWAEHFLPWFGALGYPASALSLRGHGASGGRERLHEFGLDDYADDLAALLADLAGPAVLIGHSMGATVVQKYLERGTARAAVFLCPVPPAGLLPASFALAMTRPLLFAEINAMAMGGRPSASALRSALFAGPVTDQALALHGARMQAESRRALMDLSGWGLPRRARMNLPASLVLAAAEDVLIPCAQVEAAARHLDAAFAVLPRLGHVLMLDAEWQQAAQAVHDWLLQGGL